jgi:uncharacterized membrane protein
MIEEVPEIALRPRSIRFKPSAVVSVPDQEGTKVVASVSVQESVDEIFRALSSTGLAKYILPVESVSWEGGRRFRWILKTLPGFQEPIEWVGEVFRDKPNKMFAWRTIDPSDIASAGSIWVRTLPHQRGSEIRVTLKYDIPNEFLKKDFASVFGARPEDIVAMGLRRFKSILETGEFATVAGQPHGPMSRGGSP